eukprot:SAG22_NODE_1417_length_4469_cov_2.981465_3_plen_207_part_00
MPFCCASTTTTGAVLSFFKPVPFAAVPLSHQVSAGLGNLAGGGSVKVCAGLQTGAGHEVPWVDDFKVSQERHRGRKVPPLSAVLPLELSLGPKTVPFLACRLSVLASSSRPARRRSRPARRTRLRPGCRRRWLPPPSAPRLPLPVMSRPTSRSRWTMPCTAPTPTKTMRRRRRPRPHRQRRAPQASSPPVPRLRPPPGCCSLSPPC